nr:HCLS1-associated protein X-1 isoform X3 [Pogona vitticeps]
MTMKTTRRTRTAAMDLPSGPTALTSGSRLGRTGCVSTTTLPLTSCSGILMPFSGRWERWACQHSPSVDFRGIEAPPPPDDQKRQTLRDSMLKHPDSQRPSRRALEDDLGPPVPEIKPWRPFHGLPEVHPPPAGTPKEDGDLDSRVTSEGLETVLPPAQPRSYFKSVSITKVMGPDGTVEERRTVRDSQGHEETVVTRRSAGEPREGDAGSLGPFGPPRQEGLGDTFPILDSFFRCWFSSR